MVYGEADVHKYLAVNATMGSLVGAGQPMCHCRGDGMPSQQVPMVPHPSVIVLITLF